MGPENTRGLLYIKPPMLDFLRPQMALAYRLDAISQGPRKSQFPGPNPHQLALVMDAARIKSTKALCKGPYKSYVHK